MLLLTPLLLLILFEPERSLCPTYANDVKPEPSIRVDTSGGEKSERSLLYDQLTFDGDMPVGIKYMHLLQTDIHTNVINEMLKRVQHDQKSLSFRNRS